MSAPGGGVPPANLAIGRPDHPSVEYAVVLGPITPVLQNSQQNNDLQSHMEYARLPEDQPVTGENAYSTSRSTARNSMPIL